MSIVAYQGQPQRQRRNRTSAFQAFHLSLARMLDDAEALLPPPEFASLVDIHGRRVAAKRMEHERAGRRTA